MRRPCADALVLALLLFLSGGILAACSDDDDGAGRYPSVLTELVEAEVGADSTVTRILTDRGTAYAVGQHIRTFAADTVLRCLCTYLRDADGSAVAAEPTATLYQLDHVFSQAPRLRAYFADSASSLPRDPLRLISAWKSGRWINLYVGVPTHSNSSHSFGFCADSLTVVTEGEKVGKNEGGDTGEAVEKVVLHVSLLHRQPEGDAPDFTRKTYLSLPIEPCAAQADSLRLSVTTDDGVRALGFSLR